MTSGNGYTRNGRRRVVITGLGGVAPNGIGKDAFWKNLVAGKSAVDYIWAFDASAYPCKVAAEVRDFRPSAFLDSRKAKQMGRFSHSPVAFATFCSLGSLTTRKCLTMEASRPYDLLRDGLVIAGA